MKSFTPAQQKAIHRLQWCLKEAESLTEACRIQYDRGCKECTSLRERIRKLNGIPPIDMSHITVC